MAKKGYIPLVPLTHQEWDEITQHLEKLFEIWRRAKTREAAQEKLRQLRKKYADPRAQDPGAEASRE